MHYSEESKRISNAVQYNSDLIRTALCEAFESAIVGERLEVRFFRQLLSGIESRLNSLQIGNINVKCRIGETHQKPIVRVRASPAFSRELADLLVVVKYHFESRIEAKSILYQVKLCDSGSLVCSIDQGQLALMSQWPDFEFGRLANGGPQVYSISPTTMEFGSYMLMQRAPALGQFIKCRSHFCNFRAYGISPHAFALSMKGAKVNVESVSYASNASEAFFAHIAFCVGEHHHSNQQISALVSALYRHVGMEPDPPGEFDGYFREAKEGEMRFGIIEVNVSMEGSDVSVLKK